MILKSAFIIARVEILTRIAKYFFGMRTIIFNCNYFHRKLFVVKISSIIIVEISNSSLTNIIPFIIFIIAEKHRYLKKLRV